MQTEFILRAIAAAQTALLAHEAEIESLDRAIGDGDHFINMKRGAAALAASREEWAGLTPDEVLREIGAKLLSTVGGASGPLIASFFIAMARSVKESGGETPPDMAAAFAAGVEAVKSRGKADLGEKTLLDVLIPVSRALTRRVGEGAGLAVVLPELKRVAEEGVQSTRGLVATKGRAAFLGERAIGHLDPGAKTCQVIIAALCDLALADG